MPQEEMNYQENLKSNLDEALAKEKKSWVGFFIRKYRFTYLILFAILIGGLFSLFTLPREAEPEVKVPYAVVTTVYPGANPKDIEDLITNKIEDKIGNIEDLNTYTSNSGEGISSIFVEFNATADLKESFRKLREAVDEAKPNLPNEAEIPVVMEINFNNMPIVTYSLVGDYNEVELKKFADDIQGKFEKINDVSKVEIIGGLEREFQVIVDQTKLVNFNISLGQIINSIQTGNFSLPVGNIDIDGFKYGIRVKGKFTDAEQLNNIVVATYENSPVYLGDVAEIKDGFKEIKTESKIGFKNEGSKNTISLQIYKRTGGNIINITTDAQKITDQMYQDKILPDTLKIVKTNDNSVFIKEDLNTLGTNGIQTVILITIILMLILSFRGALITALSVPISFLMSFIFLKIQGMTLNSMVLFSLVLSLGLMVDNAIVIIEGINEYAEKHNRPILEAALLSVWNFKWAITSGTMTTVAAFLPMLLVSGILGEYLSILPKTISVTLISSLVVAVVIIPTLSVRLLKKIGNGNSGPRNKKRHYIISKIFQNLHQKYTPFMKSILPNRKKRRMIVFGAFFIFLLAIAIPFSGLMKVEMFPKVDIDYFIVNIKMPIGTVLENTQKTTENVEKIISEIPELDNYVTNIGSSASVGFGAGGSNGSYLSSITVNLVKKDARELKSFEIADKIRPELEKIQEAEATVEELSAGPPSGSPIEIRIFGEDISSLTSISKEIENFLKNTSGVINIKDNLENSTGEFTFTVDRQKMNYYGLDLISIASTLRNAVYGAKASEVNLDGEDIDITVKYNEEHFDKVNDLENILLFTPSGENIPFKQIATLNLEPSLLSINHKDGKKIAAITADIEKGTNLQEVIKKFNEKKATIKLPQNFSIQVGGETEDIQKSFTETFYSMILAVILISLILVLQFNSFRQPFIIIFTLPLALIGVIIGLNILRLPFSFTAFIGIVSLSGIVVNDAIVLIDKINKNIANGMEFFEAIVDGGVSRMQPIFLTSITTIAGIFPLVYSNELWLGLSIAIIFGLSFSTILTLFIVPVMYVMICAKEKCSN